jgi:acyl-CoA thioester hydrolase
MSRIEIDIPTSFHFKANIAVRITDINYGGHVGNDTVLSLVHESRMQFLNSIGYTEMNCGGKGLIMTDAAIVFKKELFYGDIVIVSVKATNFSKISFDLFYKLEKQEEEKTVLVAKVKTAMVYFDYTAKKVTSLSAEVVEKLNSI